jgi:hypothetical protein
LSAAGSINAPRRERTFSFRAIIPSRMSVMAADRKMTNAVTYIRSIDTHRKQGTSRSRAKVRMLGMCFIAFAVLSAECWVLSPTRPA